MFIGLSGIDKFINGKYVHVGFKICLNFLLVNRFEWKIKSHRVSIYNISRIIESVH